MESRWPMGQLSKMPEYVLKCDATATTDMSKHLSMARERERDIYIYNKYIYSVCKYLCIERESILLDGGR